MIDIHNTHNQDYKDKFITDAIIILMQNGIVKPELAEEIANALLQLYSGKHRWYHTYAHINDMLYLARKYFPNSSGGTTLEPPELLAILFHDCIYVPKQLYNEDRSVDLMVSMMAGYGVPLTEFDWSSRIIKETANFLGEVKDESTHAVLDLDLASFAQEDWDEFQFQNALISKEIDSKVEQRISFMELFLSKDRIYYKLSHLEDKARENIKKYINFLKNNPTT